MNKRKYKKTNSLWLKRFILRSKWGKFFLLASLFLLINFFIQVYRKPTEIISLIYEGQSSHLEKTWHRYKDVFQANSTENVKPETLASIAQVESAGRWAASPDWQFRWSRDWKNLFSPMSSAFGLMQITNGHQKNVLEYCRHNREFLDKCENSSGWWRLLPSHSVKMAAIYIDKTILDIKKKYKIKINDDRLIELAAITHLCGNKKAQQFANKSFRLPKNEKCGSHNTHAYLNRIKRLQKRLKRL